MERANDSNATLKSQIFLLLQKIGQSLMVPVSVLPAAGLLVAVGRMLQNFSESSGVVTSPFVHAVGNICYSGGLAIFEQLPVVFAIGVAIGFTGGAGVAALASAVGYYTMINVIKIIGEERALELTVNTGVFGGILIGLVTARLYHSYHQTKLHPVFGFFSGKRLVPIITAGVALFLGILLAYVWPPIQFQINNFGNMVMGSEWGPAFYAAGKRLLIPVGLHHVYYPPFLYEFGEFVTTSGQVLKGETARYFGGDPSAGRFMASEFPIMLFGLPAATYAMYLAAPKGRRKALAGIMLSAALTSIITGITEPIEFAFIFVAPALFVFHVGAAFLSGFLIHLFDIHLGYTFSASLIDYFLGFFNAQNSFYLFAIVGPAIALLYFSVFYWAIRAFDYKTPGRDAEVNNDVATVVEGSSKAQEVLVALGGGDNITHLDACITRLRLKVNDTDKVDKALLKKLGASGVMDAGQGNLQVVFGVESDSLKDQIAAIMRGESIANSSNFERQNVNVVVNGKSVILNSPMTGSLLLLEDVPDVTFADKIMGDGFAIDPTDGSVYSPIEAEVVQVFRTQHAIGLSTKSGLEILIHVGIDTVKLEGKGFKALVKVGDHVTRGQKLLEFDLEYVKAHAKSAVTPVVVTNMEMIKELTIVAGSKVKAREVVASIKT